MIASFSQFSYDALEELFMITDLQGNCNLKKLTMENCVCGLWN